MGIDFGDAPGLDEIELTLIGPGYGECCLVHIGGGHWIIVDSCRHSETGDPAALTYLRGIGVNSNTAVARIVVTHYHDDHIRGLAELVRECAGAKLCVPVAMGRREFLVRVAAYSPELLGRVAGVTKEIKATFEEIANRPKGSTTFGIIHGIAGRRIFSLDKGDSGHGLQCEIRCLSPSDKDVSVFQNYLAQDYARLKEPKIRPAPFTPNSQSIALHVLIGEGSILLGADLEAPNDPDRGWNAVLRDQMETAARSSAIKIPHHGSRNAHCDELWRTMLLDNPWAILTPWQGPQRTTPTKEDVNRIVSLTKRAYSSAVRNPPRKSIRRDHSVEKTVKQFGIKIRRSERSTGVVRLRCKDPQDLRPQNWNVSLFDGACALQDA